MRPAPTKHRPRRTSSGPRGCGLSRVPLPGAVHLGTKKRTPNLAIEPDHEEACSPGYGADRRHLGPEREGVGAKGEPPRPIMAARWEEGAPYLAVETREVEARGPTRRTEIGHRGTPPDHVVAQGSPAQR